MSLTVTSLARSCNLARSTVLYYESIGLLARPKRSSGNYRVYGEKDLARLYYLGLFDQYARKIAEVPGR